MRHLYQYQAAVLEVTDGDTFTAMLDLGFNVYVEKKVRIYGLDAPEKNRIETREAGYAARDRLKQLIEGKNVLLIAVKEEDKYGRFLAKCMLSPTMAHEAIQDVTDIMISEGHGKEYYGGKKS